MDVTSLWPLLSYMAVVALLAATVIALSWTLGQRHKDRTTGQPFESGILPTGSARLHFSAKFYLIAMFFVIFDLEAVFIITWAVAVRESGWAGFIEIMIFTAVLLAALAYLWRTGALDWGPSQRRPSDGGK